MKPKISSKKPKELKPNSFEPILTRVNARKSKFYEANIVRSYVNFQSGFFGPEDIKLTCEDIVCQNLKGFKVYAEDPVEMKRRVTALRWHPKRPNYLAIGSKFGELAFRKFVNFHEEIVQVSDFDGTGVGGAITNIYFDPFLENSVFTSSIDGTVKRWDVEKGTGRTLSDVGADDFSLWFCSVSASESTGLIVTGDTKGNLTLYGKDLQRISSHRIHAKKLTCAEFSDTRNHLLVTASLDHTVKVWDIRNMGKNKVGKADCLETLEHQTPVNSAYFSKTNGNRLLTTDQKNQLRVYRGVNFDLETTIYHPHRQFQHLTPIKATWHPLTDLIVVGRYPDPAWPNYEAELKSIDIIEPSTGEVKVQMVSNAMKGITSLNELNASGDVLASGMGLHIFYWKFKPKKDDANDSDKSNKKDDDDDDDDDPKPKKKKPSKKTKRDDDDDDDDPKPKKKKPSKKSVKVTLCNKKR